MGFVRHCSMPCAPKIIINLTLNLTSIGSFNVFSSICDPNMCSLLCDPQYSIPKNRSSTCFPQCTIFNMCSSTCSPQYVLFDMLPSIYNSQYVLLYMPSSTPICVPLNALIMCSSNVLQNI